MNRKARRRLLVATGVSVVVFVAGIVFLLVRQSAAYHHVADLNSTLDGRKVKVSGRVQAGSIVRDAGGLHFALADDRPEAQASPPVTVDYQGQMPAQFKDDALVIVVGTYGAAARAITAESLQTKCPSKYETRAASPVPTAAP